MTNDANDAPMPCFFDDETPAKAQKPSHIRTQSLREHLGLPSDAPEEDVIEELMQRGGD
jgi:hypothetical protein